jgi:aspartate carbamoyltransferase catalytic subunit
MLLKRKDLLGIEELSLEEINLILDTANSFKEILTRPIKKVPTLRGKTIVNLFFEPSTRTRTSFELARNIEAMNVDIIIVRHSTPGAPHLIARAVKSSVINAGDGAHEHPTQALLDMFTMREKKGKLKGLKVAIVGDIRWEPRSFLLPPPLSFPGRQKS